MKGQDDIRTLGKTVYSWLYTYWLYCIYCTLTRLQSLRVSQANKAGVVHLGLRRKKTEKKKQWIIHSLAPSIPFLIA